MCGAADQTYFCPFDGGGKVCINCIKGWCQPGEIGDWRLVTGEMGLNERRDFNVDL